MVSLTVRVQGLFTQNAIFLKILASIDKILKTSTAFFGEQPIP